MTMRIPVGAGPIHRLGYGLDDRAGIFLFVTTVS